MMDDNEVKVQIRKECMYIDLPNGETVYIDWSMVDIDSPSAYVDQYITDDEQY